MSTGTNTTDESKCDTPLKAPFIELAEKDGEWNWVFWAKNGRALAMSARSYSRSNDAVAAIETFTDQLNEDVKILKSS